MSQQQQFPQRKKNALDNAKLKLSAPCPTAAGKWSSLGWGLFKNENPRITVYTNDPNDSRHDNGRIMAPMGAPDFFALMHHLQTAIDAPGKWRNKIELKNFIFPGGKRSEKPVVVAHLWVGQDEEGCIWLSVQSTNAERPKIKFVIGPGDFANWFNEAGEELSKGAVSKIYAAGYIKMVGTVMEQLLVSEYIEPAPKQQGGNGGGGGYQNNRGGNNGGGGGNGGGNNNASAGYDEDLPF